MLVFLCGSICLAQSNKPKPELFTSYVGRTTLPAKADIPAETCQAIITQADKIVTSNELKTLGIDRVIQKIEKAAAKNGGRTK